jgi:DnaK suppressor protein
MSGKQRAYFLHKLKDWKEAIIEVAGDHGPAPGRFAARTGSCGSRLERDRRSIELRTRDRQRKLISKIDCAVRRLYEGEYGYCEVTGEPISLARLEARPIAI